MSYRHPELRGSVLRAGRGSRTRHGRYWGPLPGRSHPASECNSDKARALVAWTADVPEWVIGVRLNVLPSFSFPPVEMTGLGANRGHLFDRRCRGNVRPTLMAAWPAHLVGEWAGGGNTLPVDNSATYNPSQIGEQTLEVANVLRLRPAGPAPSFVAMTPNLPPELGTTYAEDVKCRQELTS